MLLTHKNSNVNIQNAIFIDGKESFNRAFSMMSLTTAILSVVASNFWGKNNVFKTNKRMQKSNDFNKFECFNMLS